MPTDSNSTTDGNTYTQKMRGDMKEWQQKLRTVSEMAKARGDRAGNAAENELNTACNKVEA